MWHWLLLQLFSVGLQPIDTSRTSAALLTAETCAGCHADVHGEWAQSRHALAFTNAIFQREYKLRPLTWCVNCHAPLAAQAAEIHNGGGTLANEGVNCATCHVRDNRIVAREHRAKSPHDTDVRADFGSPSFCAGCHQFNFPIIANDGAITYTQDPMQDTVAQHHAGPDRDRSCRSCHALEGAQHRYPGGHDLAMLRRALSLEVCRTAQGVSAFVENRGAGHRMPTGDVHRHLVLRVWQPSAPERLYETVFRRRFRARENGGKALIDDTTLAPRERRELPVPAATFADMTTASVELRYIYTADEFPRAPLAEPNWVTVTDTHVDLATLPACAPR